MSASTVRLVDIEDDELIDKLAMRVTEINIKERQNKRKRRASSTDEDVTMDEDDDVSLAMLLEAKQGPPNSRWQWCAAWATSDGGRPIQMSFA